MTDRPPAPRPPGTPAPWHPGTPAPRRVDPWLVGLGVVAVLVVGFFLFTAGRSTPATTTTTRPPPPVGESAILQSARDLTRGEEGLASRPYHPAPESGVSIGYGYDMRERTGDRVRSDLSRIQPPIQPEWIDALAAAAGLTGQAAQAFVDDHGVIFLTLEQADALFDVTYAEEAVLAREFATNPEDLSAFGVTYAGVESWDALHPAIRGVLIDLKFRGDYRPWWPEQQMLQNAVAANDPIRVLDAIADPTAFPGDLTGSVRFWARLEWMGWVLGSPVGS